MTNTVAYILGILTLPAFLALWMTLGWYLTRRDNRLQNIRWSAAVEKYGKQYDNLTPAERSDFDDSLPKWESREDNWPRTVYIMQGGHKSVIQNMKKEINK
jgi:hypothetical protein